MKIALDILGSDLGTEELQKGILSFLSHNKDCEVIAVGDESQMSLLKGVCETFHAPDIIPMEAGPLDVMRKKNSSMYAAIQFVKDGKADAVVSAGSTGGFLSAATLILKTAQNVKRAALVSPFPTKIKGKKVVILDIGANNENTPEQLEQFAIMGEEYSKCVFNNESPKLFLLSNGTEEGKGSPLVKETHKLLKNRKSFCGNIEARDALNGEADIIVTDGYTGNILLKSLEGMAKMMSGFIKNIFKKNLWTMLGYLHVKKGMKEMTKTMDYKSTGGAMLLGINGVVVKAHGNSNAYAFECAINVAKKMVKSKIVENISKGLSENE